MSFETKNEDGVPLWQVLYELLIPAEVDTIVTYEALGEAIGGDRASVQSSIRRAARELLVNHKRAIKAVPNVGYRIVRPEEHLVLARAHQTKSTRALKRGYSDTIHVDMNNMSQDVRTAFEVVAQAFSMQMEFNRRLDVRQVHLQKQIDEIHPTVERNQEELAELRARLSALEQG